MWRRTCSRETRRSIFLFYRLELSPIDFFEVFISGVLFFFFAFAFTFAVFILGGGWVGNILLSIGCSHLIWYQIYFTRVGRLNLQLSGLSISSQGFNRANCRLKMCDS